MWDDGQSRPRALTPAACSSPTRRPLITAPARRTHGMSVSFFGIDHRHLEATPYGAFPTRVRLSNDAEGDLSDARSVNLANENAVALFGLLGLDPGDGLCGGAPLPDVSRAIMRAKATFRRRVGAFLREDVVVYGEPRVNEDGTVELRPVRVWSAGIDADYLWRQLDRLEVLVQALEARGAKHLGWG